ncbi:MAG: AAA family ATPase [Acidimicrobiales bacterium]
MVGRVAELGLLEVQLRDALVGRGGFAFVRGDAGIGKSRLCRELIDGAPGEGFLSLVGRALPSSVSSPYRPIAELVLQATRVRGFPLDEPALAPWLPAIRTIVPLPGVPIDEVGEDVSSTLRGEALLRLFGWLSNDCGLLIVFEDLHWADADTLELIEYLADNLDDQVLLCVATVRRESRSPANELAERLHRRDRASLIDLASLDDTAVERIARAIAPDIDSDDLTRIRILAEGVPFLVEELIGSPGVPQSFAETVSARVEKLDPAHLEVLVSAALLGRSVDWTLLASASGQPVSVVTQALDIGVELQLLSHDAGDIRFRHALTRDALLGNVLRPRRAALADRGLKAVEAKHPELDGPWAGVAADLAVEAGLSERAGELMALAGTRALRSGALATAAETLLRAVDLLAPGPARAAVQVHRVQALALAGRTQEAVVVGANVIAELSEAGDPEQLVDVHLHLARAALAAARWQPALDHVVRARALLNETVTGTSGWRSRAAVIEAEARLATGDVADAVALVETVLADADGDPEARCHACELLGRSVRVGDLARARAAFEQGLSIAVDAGLPVWRLRALHELATIDLLDEGATGRLLEARQLAETLGAVSTLAMLDIQLAAAWHLRFEIDAGEQCAQEALALSERLGLDRLRLMALWFIAESHALRMDWVEAERVLATAREAAPDDPEIEGMAWAGARAMTALLSGDRPTALDALARGMAILSKQPQAPGHYRGMWPLLLAAQDDRRAGAALTEARDLGIDVNRLNRGYLSLAEAILRGRRGDIGANALVEEGRSHLARYPVWRELGLLLVAEAARRDGWGAPDEWLEDAARGFDKRGLIALADQARACGSSVPRRWTDLGITSREVEVLDLVAEGLANKQIASRLALSVRTVEKHVEGVLRKTGCASRTQLIALAHR